MWFYGCQTSKRRQIYKQIYQASDAQRFEQTNTVITYDGLNSKVRSK